MPATNPASSINPLLKPVLELTSFTTITPPAVCVSWIAPVDVTVAVVYGMFAADHAVTKSVAVVNVPVKVYGLDNELDPGTEI